MVICSTSGCMLLVAAAVESSKPGRQQDPMSCNIDKDCDKFNNMYCQQATAGSGTCRERSVNSNNSTNHPDGF